MNFEKKLMSHIGELIRIKSEASGHSHFNNKIATLLSVDYRLNKLFFVALLINGGYEKLWLNPSANEIEFL